MVAPKLWRGKQRLSREAREIVKSSDAIEGLTNDTFPKCVRCSALAGRRIAVHSYDVVNTGSINGVPFIEVKAKCHEEEETLRVGNYPWPAPEGEMRYQAYLIALPFFSNKTLETLFVPQKYEPPRITLYSGG